MSPVSPTIEPDPDWRSSAKYGLETFLSRANQPIRSCASDTDFSGDAGRNDPRHVPVHGARAARGEGMRTEGPTSSPSGACSTEMATGKKAFFGSSQASLIG